MEDQLYLNNGILFAPHTKLYREMDMKREYYWWGVACMVIYALWIRGIVVVVVVIEVMEWNEEMGLYNMNVVDVQTYADLAGEL